VRFVHHDKIPIGGDKFVLNVRIPAEFVETAKAKAVLLKPVAGARGLQPFVRQNVELKIELLVQFILPLFHKASGSNDQTPRNVPANDEFLDQQPSHDGFPGARIICQEKPQRLTVQHGFIDGGDLVWQRLDR